MVLRSRASALIVYTQTVLPYMETAPPFMLTAVPFMEAELTARGGQVASGAESAAWVERIEVPAPLSA